MTFRSFTDQTSNSIILTGTPKRIVSLVPSQTELLADLGLDSQVVGITQYCVHPTHWRSEKMIVGGTKNFDTEAIASLKPDLILANKEENSQVGIEFLKEKFPVWISDIFTLDDALFMIRKVGEMTGMALKANEIICRVTAEFTSVKKSEGQRVLYLIWRKPWMAAGQKTFINAMLKSLGLQNCLSPFTRYPVLSEEMIGELKPDLILLSSEPYPFREKHSVGLKNISPESLVLLVDGEMFSWYGSRLMKAPDYFNSLPL